MKHEAAFADIHLFERIAPRRGLQHAMLVGFDAVTRAKVSEVLRSVPLIPHAMDEPYSAMQTLTDDPGSWMTCILDAEAFSDELPLDRYLRILRHQGHLFGIILGNAPADLRLDGLADSDFRLDATLCDVTRPDQIIYAIRTVLRRRGFLDPRDGAFGTHAKASQAKAAIRTQRTRNRPAHLSVRKKDGSVAPLRLTQAVRSNLKDTAHPALKLVPMSI